MLKNLVSLITPVYNTGQYVHRLLDSVLLQDYPEIEMIVVDDGSTDNSKEVIESYIDKFLIKGYRLVYIYQDNAGQSSAIKNGLQYINGEFFAWPDSDDFYASNDAISRMVDVLQSSDPIFQVVRTQESIVEDVSLKPIEVKGRYAKEEEDQSLFEDCLFVKNDFYFCSGAYMVRTAILKELTDFDIYTAHNTGQNWQLLLPILYKYRCKTILAPLYNVVDRKSSHSRGQYSGYYATVKKYDAYLNTQIETLKRIKGFPTHSIPDYRKQLQQLYDLQLLKVAIKDNKRQESLIRFKSCKSIMGGFKFFIVSVILHFKGGTYIINAYQKTLGKVI